MQTIRYFEIKMDISFLFLFFFYGMLFIKIYQI